MYEILKELVKTFKKKRKADRVIKLHVIKLCRVIKLWLCVLEGGNSGKEKYIISIKRIIIPSMYLA